MDQLHLGTAVSDGKPVDVDPELLLDHSLVVGTKGTGKTTLGRQLIDQIVGAGVSVLAIDTSGDMTASLMEARSLPLLTSDDQPSGDRTDPIELRSMDASFAEGMFVSPTPEIADELAAEELESQVSALLALLGHSPRPFTPEHAFLSAVLEKLSADPAECSLAQLVRYIDSPPITRVGVYPLDQVISPARRKSLASALDSLLRSHGFRGDPSPMPVDLESQLFDGDNARAVVVSFPALAETTRQFVASVLLARLRTVMARRSGSGSRSLRAVAHIDEAGALLPRDRRALTAPLLREALDGWGRFGIGLVLVTETVDSLDEDAQDLCQTWFAGRLPVPTSRYPVVQALDLVNPPIDEVWLDATLKDLEAGQFVLRSRRLDSLRTFAIDPAVWAGSAT